MDGNKHYRELQNNLEIIPTGIRTSRSNKEKDISPLLPDYLRQALDEIKNKVNTLNIDTDTFLILKIYGILQPRIVNPNNKEHCMNTKTYKQIINEYPFDTFMDALKKASLFMQEHPRPIAHADIEKLKQDSPTAFEVFSAIMDYVASTPDN